MDTGRSRLKNIALQQSEMLTSMAVHCLILPKCIVRISAGSDTMNWTIVEMLKTFAAKKEATPAQISLAWMLYKYPNVVPIPGSKNKEKIIENLNAANVELSTEEFSSLEEKLNKHKVYGHRGLGGF